VIKGLKKKEKGILFCVKKCFFHNGENWSHRVSPSFENKKYIIKINFSLQIIELFTPHLVIYFAV
jgi:hypothetical protein